MTPTRRNRLTHLLMLTLVLGAATACSDDAESKGTTVTTSPTTEPTAATSGTVAVNGTSLHVEHRGAGDPLLIVHGGGEDAAMLSAQADSLALAGYHVITYDRRGTGRSGRTDWPGSGAAQHADDAAALLEVLDTGPATVLGVSSGGVIALTLAARHPDQVRRVIAWEPPAAGVVPGGPEITGQIMEPVERHLDEQPGDFVGAQAILLSAIVGFPVTVDDPAFAAARANAEPMIRDEPAITLATFDHADFEDRDITIATGSQPNDIIAAAVSELAVLTGHDAVTVDADHEVYLNDPAVLTRIVGTATSS
jgi:pimeloyl-ACP methyl ester carboxylesterase